MLSSFTWRVERGAVAEGSGEVAETIRRLKARGECDAALPPGGVPAPTALGRGQAAVRDDERSAPERPPPRLAGDGSPRGTVA